MGKGFMKKISGIIVFFLVISLFPNTGMAAATKEPVVSLEQAIETLKLHFAVPEGYTVFSSAYRSSDNQQVWALNWGTEDNRTGSFNAEVDASTGLIVFVNQWKEGKPQTEIPVLSVEEARRTGTKLLEELAPAYLDRLKPVPGNELIPLTSWEGGQYVLQWQRMENGIPVDHEGVTIQIDYTNGQVKGYRLSWSNGKLPLSTGIISGDQARESLVKNQMLELQYLIPAERTKSQTQKEPAAKLVYRIHHPSNGSIDAITGKPVENRDMRMMNEKMMMGGRGSAEQAADLSVLSPQEQEEIERTLSLISQDKAIRIVKQWVSVPAELELKGINLNQDYQNKELRIWNLNWNSESGSTSPAYVNARVNASTGELISFDQYGGEALKEEASLTRETAQDIAESFLEKINADRAKQLRLDIQGIETPYLVSKVASLPDQWYFQYERMVKGIPCPAEGINITVDSKTKAIRSYYLNWTGRTFSSTNNVMTVEKAYNTFLGSQPLTLHYVRSYSMGQVESGQYQLIYSPMAVTPALQTDVIDAVTGEKLGWDGKPLANNPLPKTFTDIRGHFAEKEISLLGQAGIMCEYETAFHPDEEITLVAMLRAMLVGKNNYVNGISDEEVMKEAVRMKWITQEMSPNTKISREFLAKLMVRLLDVEFIAKMPSAALQAPYQDYATLNPDSKGYAALTWGLGIIRGDGKHFDALHNTTRGEAAAVLVRTLKTC